MAAVSEALGQLKQWLKERRHRYVETRRADDGCETCGWGGTEFDVLNDDALDFEIDAFAAEFEAKRVQKNETDRP